MFENVSPPSDEAFPLSIWLRLSGSSQTGDWLYGKAWRGGAKPRIVDFKTQRDGKDSVQVAGQNRSATRMKIHIDLGGVAGVVAPMVGKQPTDTYVWLMDGDVRSFIRMQGALYQKGPIWKAELASPTWPKNNDH